MSHRRLLALILSLLTAGALVLTAAAPATAASRAAAPSGTLTTAVTGTVNGVAESGTLTINRFVRDGRDVFAVGQLDLGDASGAVRVPLVRQDPTCPVLNLTLGPLDLNLLGLVVHLDQVVLTITAQSGAGNLLGNLLCAVANLLNGTGPAGALTNLLNQILALL